MISTTGGSYSDYNRLRPVESVELCYVTRVECDPVDATKVYSVHFKRHVPGRAVAHIDVPVTIMGGYDSLAHR